jgi:hypothetical protein
MGEGEAEAMRVFLAYPDNWDELSREEKLAVARQTARIIQDRLGIVPRQGR